jgi:hypothetical protein
MKVLALLLLLAGVVVQEPDEYPPGHVCVRAVDVKGPTDHPCSCHRKCSDVADNDGHHGAVIVEDPQCQQYCHKEHCSCPVENCE